MKKNYKKIISGLIIAQCLLLVSASTALAQSGGGANPQTGGTNLAPTAPTSPINITLRNPFRNDVDSIFELLRLIINDILLPIGGVLAVLAFIYSGFLYVTAQGNETKLKTAHTALLYTAVGTALLLGAWVFANAICNTIELISQNPNICPTN